MAFFIQMSWFLKRHKVRYALIVVAIIISSVISLIPPLIIASVVDSLVIGKVDNSELFYNALLIVSLGISTYLFRFYWRKWLFGSALELEREMMSRLYNKLSHFSPRFYQQHSTGKLLTHLSSDIVALSNGIGNGVIFFVDAFVISALVLIILSTQINLMLTLAVLLPLPVLALLIRYYGQQMQQRIHNSQQSLAEFNQSVQQSISGIAVIKSYAGQAQQKKAFAKKLTQLTAHNIEQAKIESRYEPTTGLILGLCIILSISFGGWLIQQEQITVGQLLAFNMYLGYLIWPMNAFGMLFNILELAKVSLFRIDKLLSAEQSIKTPIATAQDVLLKFKIDNFRHQNSDDFCLKALNLSLMAGEFNALIGKAGAGKSTLLALILGAYPLKKDQRQLNKNTQFSYVPQTPQLFKGTIAENISLGKPYATEPEILRAANLACLDTEIERMTQGYQTMIGESGNGLSGGQKQRLALARALLTDASILILDDALSALDQHTAQKVQFNLRFWMGTDKAILLASSRLDNLQSMDKILILSEGEITDQGSHQELISTENCYQKAYQQQYNHHLEVAQ